MQNTTIHPVEAAGSRRSRTGLLAGAILMAVTAVAMVDMARVIVPSPDISTSRASIEPLVRDFYAGVNEALATGGNSELLRSVDDQMLFHGAEGTSALNLTEFVDRLTAIGQVDLGMQLTVTSLAVNGLEAVVTVRISGGGDALMAAPLIHGAHGWIDRVIVRGGVVASLDGGTSGLHSSTTLMDSPIAYGYAGAVLKLATLTIGGGESVPIEARGTLVVAVQQGTLTAIFDGAYVPTLKDRPGEPAGPHVVFRPGDHVAVRAGSSFRLSAEAGSPVIVRVALLFRAEDFDPATIPSGNEGRFSDFLPRGKPGAIWNGEADTAATIELRAITDIQPGMSRIRLDRLELHPGASVLPPLVAGPGQYIVLLAAQGVVVVEPEPAMLDQLPLLIEPSRSSALAPGTYRIRQAGALPAELLIVRIDSEDLPIS